MFAVDTHLFVYAHFDLYPQHEKARAFCQGLLSSADDWCIGWQVVYEYVRITTHPSIHKIPLSIEQALSDLAPYLDTDSGHVLTHTAQHRPVLEAVASAVPTARGNFIHDVHYAALLREHGVSRIYTADSDFEKFGFLEVIDPTAA
ncbi:MAG: PIN domain-containing protein [Candidatus Riflebacteria bacterium]|nr:PIN domain-containing protein [Candidatus Riflebacteria bacterium]